MHVHVHVLAGLTNHTNDEPTPYILQIYILAFFGVCFGLLVIIVLLMGGILLYRYNIKGIFYVHV